MTPGNAAHEAATLLRRLQNWTPEGQQQAADLLARARSSDWRPWWCGDYTCDGKPHGDWEWAHARGDQHPPRTGWDTWIELSGRGSGKTRSGAEWTHRMTTRTRYIALVAPTSADARDTLVEGESGLLATASPSNPCLYESSKRRVTWRNGARATLFSSEEPDRLRGPQHGAAWVDEACFYAQPGDVWDNLQFGLRLGAHPRAHITTTPKPRQWLKDRLADPNTVISTASTYANLDNLAPSFQRAVLAKYEGTRLGRQEIHAEVLEDIEGALWTNAMIDGDRVAIAPTCSRIIVAVDPGGSQTPGRETGIIVLGRFGGHAVILQDLSGTYSPAEWGTAVIAAYTRWSADAVIAETNFGGDMVPSTIHLLPGGATIPVHRVNARRGKILRAEPVASLYEQHRIHHLGVHAVLEGQMTSFTGDDAEDSPDRLDAMVHGVTDLLITGGEATLQRPTGRRYEGSYRR